MSSLISKKAKLIAWLCTFVYFGSYMTRKNLSVMFLYVSTELESATGLSLSDIRVQLAIVFTGMTIAYGVGQVVCGFLGDKIKPQYMLTGGLALAATTNIIMAIPGVVSLNNTALMVVLWSVNGVAHSMLWPPIVRIISMYLNDDEYGYAVVRVSWGSQFATILLFIMCPILSDPKLIGLNWRWVMMICAAIGVAICVCWTISAPRLLVNPIHPDRAQKKGSKKASGVPLPKFVIIPLVLIFLGIILQGIMRDGIEQWASSLIKGSFGLGDFASTLSTVLLAIFGIASFSIYNFIYNKIFKNEVLCAGMIFAFSAILAGIILLLFIFSVNSAALFIVIMAIIVANMHGINLMLISVVPKRFVKSGKVAFFSGLLNAFTYVGASIGTLGFAWLSALKFESLPEGHILNGGTVPVVISWIVVSILGCAVVFFCVPLWKKFLKGYAENDELVLEENNSESEEKKEIASVTSENE